jgi:predicted acylesterase/phospholipase RssA
VITYAYEAMQAVVNRYRLAGFPPDVLITVPKDGCRTLGFQRAAPTVELGRELTAHALEAFEARPAPTPSSPSSTCADWGVVAREQRWSHGIVSRHRQQSGSSLAAE